MRILVVGAGIAGLTAATILSRDGHDVLVVEKNPGLRVGGYMIDFLGPGFDAAEHLGLLQKFEAIHYPIANLVFVDSKGRTTASIPYSLLRRRLFHDRHFNFLRSEMERVLYEAAREVADVRFGVSPASLDFANGAVGVRSSDGSQREFDLVIGADGVHSSIRRLAFPNGVVMRDLGCRTAAYVIPSVLKVPSDSFITMSGAGLTASVYPIRGGRTATFFLYARDPVLHERTPGVCQRQLDVVFRGRGWILDELLDAFTSVDLFFDDVVQVEMENWVRGRVVLLGDACGCVSLLAGQGASMAMAGAYVLAQELRKSGELVEALARYEGRIRPAVSSRQRARRRNAAWFLPRSEWRARLRDKVTSWTVRSPFAPLLARSVEGAPLSLA